MGLGRGHGMGLGRGHRLLQPLLHVLGQQVEPLVEVLGEQVEVLGEQVEAQEALVEVLGERMEEPLFPLTELTFWARKRFKGVERDLCLNKTRKAWVITRTRLLLRPLRSLSLSLSHYKDTPPPPPPQVCVCASVGACVCACLSA
jgi:hypothetical protein